MNPGIPFGHRPISQSLLVSLLSLPLPMLHHYPPGQEGAGAGPKNSANEKMEWEWEWD